MSGDRGSAYREMERFFGYKGPNFLMGRPKLRDSLDEGELVAMIIYYPESREIEIKPNDDFRR